MKLNKEQRISILAVILSTIIAITSNEIRCLAGLGCKCYIDRQSFQKTFFFHRTVTDAVIIENFWVFLFFLIPYIAMFIFLAEENIFIFDQNNRFYTTISILGMLLFGGLLIAMIYLVKC